MSFTFNDNIPATNNNPSVDQPDMLTNNVSTNGIINVDHISFNLANGGNHRQVHLPAFTAPVVVDGTATQGSVLYSKAGTADNTRAQLFFKNNNTKDCPVSLIKAYGVFDTTGAIISNQAINLTVNLITNPWSSSNGYTIFIDANVVTLGGGATYGVLVTPNQSGFNPLWGFGYTITSATQFNVGFRRVDNNAFGQPTDGFTAIVYQL